MRKVIGYTVTNGIIFKASGEFSKLTGEFQQGSYDSKIVKAATLKHYKKDTFRGKPLRQYKDLNLEKLIDFGIIETL